MADWHLGLMALSVAGALVAAGLLGRRGGHEARDTRLMLGLGAALGGVALVLFSLGRMA